MDLLNPAPTFSNGQVFSAGAHGNALCQCIQDLHDSVLSSFHEAFGGGKSAVRAYTGAIRHRYNLLDWKYTIVSGTVYLAYTSAASVKTTITGTSNTGAGTYSGQTDLTSLGFVDGDFYTVTIEGGGEYYLELLREARAPSYPTLTTFADGTVPTAAQWQALSDYVTELGHETTYPYVPLVRTPTDTTGSQFIGTMHHQCRYLHLEVCRGGTISVKVNGNEVGPYTGGSGGGSADNITPDVDLDGIATPPDYGDDYSLEIGTSGPGMLFTLYEWPGETEEVASWQTLPSWAHGDYLYGSTTAQKVQTVVADLGVLAAVAKYQNYPCGEHWVTEDWRFQMRRHYRYLHFYHETGDSEPKIAYLVGASYKEMTLSTGAAGPWQVFDLDTVERLWPSTFYLIAGCSYVLEDVEP
jgi:hypothetical protein